ncbi:transglutaminase domain-containing protein [Aequorivita sinensis]|uniref:transglutaminase domain-containing protein n=1 Tax=Aequorivita sinensis TaxID=1382458 RepID=UPI0023001352|nr:transglutaminase domain-containing protein [Aequorivita sinensis]
MKTNLLSVIITMCFLNISVAQDYRFGKVSKEELLQKEHPTDPSANAAVLYREVKTEFQYNQDSGWYMVTDYFERVKIYNKEGFDWANAEINLYKGEGEDKLQGLRGNTYYLDENGKVQDEKLRKDGIFEEETSKYLTQTKITMPAVREGAVIEYKYTINSPFIFNIDEFRFQETIPIEKVNMVFKTPEYFIYKTHQRGWVPYKVDKVTRERSITFRQTTRDLRPLSGSGIPETTTREVKFKEDTYSVDIDNVPALKEEAFVGNLNNYTTALQFEMSYIDFPGSPLKTYATNWEDVSKSIYRVDLFGAELERKNYFEKDLNNILQGVSSSEEKIGRIFSFVLNKMTWNGYNGYYTNEGVRDAYKKGSGNAADINLMLVAMLRHANLEANPVLVSTKSHGIPLFPTRNGFNYVIAGVQLPQGILLLDATNKDAEIGVLKSSIQNWKGRVVKKDGTSSWVSLSSIIPAVKSTMIAAEITPDLMLTGKNQSRFTGNYAFKYRSDFKSLNEDAQRKKIEKDLTPAELANLEFENLASPGAPVSLKYDFEAMDLVEDVAGKLYFSPMVFLATEETPFKTETRLYPIDFGYPIKDRYIVTISLPEGYNVESLPENVVYNLGENQGTYRYLISQAGNKLQLSVEFAINQSYIAAEDYGNLKKFFELLIAKENEKVVLSKA